LDEFDGFEILGIDSTGEVSIVSNGTVVLGSIRADENISLFLFTGDFVNGNGVIEPNIEGLSDIAAPFASLQTLQGGIGDATSPITFVVTRIEDVDTINLFSTIPPVINNILGANVGSELQFTDPFSEQRDAAIGASVLAAIEEIGYVDWAGLDPDVRLVDCLEPCIKLPCDQLEDEELECNDDRQLAWFREPTQILVIRTVGGVRLVPIYSEPITRNSVGTRGTDFGHVPD